MTPRILCGDKPEWLTGLQQSLRGKDFHLEMAPLDMADLSGFDAVVPLSLEDTAELHRRRAAGEKPPAHFPSLEALRLCDDKLAFNRRMIACGLGRYISPMIEGVPSVFPVVLKQRWDNWGRHSHVLAQAEDLVPHREQLEAGTSFLQQHVAGNVEYATHLLLCDGVLRFQATIEYTMPDRPYIKGMREAGTGRWIGRASATPVFLAMLEAAGFRDGTCCVDYKVVDGMPLVFEVNPRLGGSLAWNAAGCFAAYLDALDRGIASGAGAESARSLAS